MTKTAMITICGRPNVGKSTLTNALVGEKIAIVSPKPQTTRSRITAIVSHGDTQFVLLDTPGFHKPRTRLGDYMVNVVRESVADVDCVLLLVEPIPSVGPQEEALIERLRQAKVPDQPYAETPGQGAAENREHGARAVLQPALGSEAEAFFRRKAQAPHAFDHHRRRTEAGKRSSPPPPFPSGQNGRPGPGR